jgi:hypothetical protein
MKIRATENARIGDYDYVFDCPGCGYSHGIFIKKEGYSGPTWEFNGDMDKPTINPSINHTMMSGKVLMHRCHSFVKNGKIQYLSDCTHKLVGQTVELPEI